MTKAEKREYMEMPTLAYYSGCAGIEIKSIEYGIYECVVFVAGAWASKSIQSVHKARVYNNSKGNYFKYHGYIIPMNECLVV